MQLSETTPANVPAASPEATLALRKKALSALGILPPFSVVLNRLMASLAERDVEYAAIGELIEKDTVISASVLQVVNSAMYARRGTVNSVRHALALIGLAKVRNLVLGMSLTRIWNSVRMPPSWSMARFNMHSSATAVLSDCLAQRVAVAYGEGAFVAGLLHDVGRLLIALKLPAEHERVVELHRTSGRPIHECEMEILGFAHPELSAEALRFWNLPEPIAMAAMYHHDPAHDTSPVFKTEVPLSALVNAADLYIDSEGAAILPVKEAGAGDPTPLLALGLDETRTERLVAEFKAECSAMAQFFK